MGKINSILRTIWGIAKNGKIWFRVLTLIVVGFAGAIMFSKTKQAKDITCEKDRTDLINVLREIKSDLQPTSFIPKTGLLNAAILFPISDTIPIKKIISKIDSLLLKYKIDSLKKQKS